MGCFNVRAPTAAAAADVADLKIPLRVPGRRSVRRRHAYELRETLGAGAFGQVCAATSAASRTHRAVKAIALVRDEDEQVERSDLPGLGRLQSAQREVKLWRSVGRHPNCVALLRSFEDSGFFFMIMELCQANLMEDFVHFVDRGPAEIVRIFREMLQGLDHVHRRSICHRDVKLANFLFGGDEGKTIKLCDFGLAERVPKRGRLLRGVYGTVPFMSPEMAGKLGHTLSTDVWSLGVSVYVLLFANFPYGADYFAQDSGVVRRAIVMGVPAPTYRRRADRGPGADANPDGDTAWAPAATAPPDAAEAFARLLLKRCSPDKRSTAREALQDPFLKLAY